MKNRLAELREAKGLSQRKLAAMIGTTGQNLGKIERGTAKLTVDYMTRLAPVLGVEPADLIGTVLPMRAIIVHGAVQAGHWNEALEWPETDRYAVSVPIDPKFAAYPQFGLEVHGPSMNERYPEGAILICVRLFDTPFSEPKNGRRYIVQRIRQDGSYEATVKEYSTEPDGVPRLWPRSNHPDHRTPLPLTGLPGETIVLHAIVIGSYIPEI